VFPGTFPIYFVTISLKLLASFNYNFIMLI
jgi:hypothetical protein